MAAIKIQDIFVRELWTEDFLEKNDEIINITNSGLFVKDPDLDAKVNSNDVGSIIEVPYFKEPEYIEPAIMDDSDDNIVPTGISNDKYFAMIGFYAKAWAEKDIVKTINSGSDPLALLTKLVGRYWATDIQVRALKIIEAIAADSIANHNSDLVNVIGTDAAGDPTDSELINASAVIDATSIVGDKLDDYAFAIMHSKVYNDLRKQQAIENTKLSSGVEVPTYLGKRVIVNDRMPVTSGTNRKIYTTMFAKRGSLAYSNKSELGLQPAEVVRDGKTGKGAGETSLITRRGMLIHPNGYEIVKGNVAGLSPSLAELGDAVTWNRKVDANRSNFCFVQSN